MAVAREAGLAGWWLRQAFQRVQRPPTWRSSRTAGGGGSPSHPATQATQEADGAGIWSASLRQQQASTIRRTMSSSVHGDGPTFESAGMRPPRPPRAPGVRDRHRSGGAAIRRPARHAQRRRRALALLPNLSPGRLQVPQFNVSQRGGGGVVCPPAQGK